MPSDPNAHSSDLDQARALSQRLRGPTVPATGRAPQEKHAPAEGHEEISSAQSHTSVRQGEAPVAATASQDPADSREAPVDPAHWQAEKPGSRRWGELLAEVLEVAEAAGAKAAFAVDAQGLTICQTGEIDGEKLEATGARLVIAVEQAARMEAFSQRPRALSIEFDAGCLTSLQIDIGPRTSISLGVVARRALDAPARAAITRLITQAVSR